MGVSWVVSCGVRSDCLQDWTGLDVHDTQAHESADGDFLLRREGQVPYDGDG